MYRNHRKVGVGGNFQGVRVWGGGLHLRSISFFREEGGVEWGLTLPDVGSGHFRI